MQLAADANPIYHTFVIGRVRFVVTDLRSQRDPNSQTDDANKSMMGSTQKQWFKDTIAAATEPVIIWASSVSWTAPTSNSDNWGDFSTERAELADWLKDNSHVSKMVILSGDIHALCADDGTNNDNYATGGGAAMPELCGSALDQSGSSKGGPWSEGSFSNGVGDGQYGLVDVTDDGGATISVRLRGIRVNGASKQTMIDFTVTKAA